MMTAVLSSGAFLACLCAAYALCRWSASRHGLPLDLRPYQDFAGSLDLAILVVSGNLERTLYASPGVSTVFGADLSRSPLAVLGDLVVEDDWEGLLSALQSKDGAGRGLEFRIKKNGSLAWIQAKMYPVPGFFSRRTALWAQDVSGRKRDELTIVQARDYEIAVGARIQQSLLLGTPDREYASFRIASLTLPSQQIDGDFIEFFHTEEEVLDLIIGDVMGKGVAAALTGAAARNAFVQGRLKLAESSAATPFPVRDIVQAAEQRIAHRMIAVGTFVTLVYGRLDGRAGLFRYVDCGHTSIMHFERRSGRCWRLKGSNTPMGFLPEQEFAEYAVPIEAGDLLFLYSDGISEAANSEGELFGEERLVKLIRGNAELDASALLEKIKQITFAYSAGNFKDDVTGISVKVLEHRVPVRSFTEEFTQRPESLRAIRAFFERSLEELCGAQCGLVSDRKESILIALGEAASNIFKHNSAEEHRTCTASCRGSEDWIAFYLYYHGVEYEWDEPPVPSVESLQTSGYGLYLIDEAMDSVTLSAGDDDAFRLCLLAELRPGARP